MKYDFLSDTLKKQDSLELYISQRFLSLRNTNTEEKENYELELLYKIMSLYLNRVDFSKPYSPFIEFKNGRSFNLSDLTEKDAKFLFQKIEKLTENPIILARVFDVLWLTKKLKKDNPIAGEKAASYFAQYIKLMLTHNLYAPVALIVSRYITLGLSLPYNSNERSLMFENYEKWINIVPTPENEFFIRELYKLHTNKTSFGDKDKNISKMIIERSENYINNNFEDPNYGHIQIYIEIIISHAKRLKDPVKESETWVKFKDYYMTIASKSSDPSLKVLLLKNAIECLRKIKKNPYKKEILNLQKEIETLQPEILTTLHTFKSEPIDTTELIKNSFKLISGKNTSEAMIVLEQNMEWISEKYIKENSTDALTDEFFPTVIINQKGQSKNTSKYKPAEQRLISFHYSFILRCVILPMLDIFKQEHFFNDFSFIHMLKNHPLVPEGYEKTYSKGLYYYLNKEFFEAAHILIPAFENSLRYLLSLHHPISYFSDKDKDKDIIEINRLINLLEANKLISSNISINLKYFFGPDDCNVRNELMHGMLPFENIISSCNIISALSLIYWMIMYPYELHPKKNKKKKA